VTVRPTHYYQLLCVCEMCGAVTVVRHLDNGVAGMLPQHCNVPLRIVHTEYVKQSLVVPA